jgi:hypothetical protein
VGTLRVRTSKDHFTSPTRKARLPAVPAKDIISATKKLRFRSHMRVYRSTENHHTDHRLLPGPPTYRILRTSHIPCGLFPFSISRGTPDLLGPGGRLPFIPGRGGLRDHATDTTVASHDSFIIVHPLRHYSGEGASTWRVDRLSLRHTWRRQHNRSQAGALGHHLIAAALRRPPRRPGVKRAWWPRCARSPPEIPSREKENTWPRAVTKLVRRIVHAPLHRSSIARSWWEHEKLRTSIRYKT